MEVTAAPQAGTPFGRYVATETGALAYHLLTLDDLWTAELELAAGKGSLGDDDVEMFSRLVGAMRRGLEQIEPRARELRHMLEDAGDENVDQAFAAIVSSPLSPHGLAERMQAHLTDYELRSATITACDYVCERAGAEARLLDEKLSTIRDSREVTPGDFRLPFRCAVLLLVVGAAAAATIVAGGPHVIVGILVVDRVRSATEEWVNKGCPIALEALRAQPG